MDWQHLIMNGENLAEYAALLAAEGLLGHQHANSGWGTFDDDNMVGATAFMETLELARRAAPRELRRRTASGSASTSTRTPRTPSAPSSARCCSGTSSTASRRKIDEAALREAQQTKDAVRAYELVYAALGAYGDALVGIDVGTTGVKGVAISPSGRGARDRRGGLPALDAAARAGRSRIPRTGGARRRRCSRGSPRPGRSASPARCTVSSRSTSEQRVLRPAILWNDQRTGGRVRRDRGARRARAADRADRQPCADRLHRAEAALAAHARAGGLRADRAHPAAEGLRPAAARRASSRSTPPTRRGRCSSTWRTGAGATRCSTRSRSRASGCRRVYESTEIAGAGDQAAGALGVGDRRARAALGRARHVGRRLRRAAGLRRRRRRRALHTFCHAVPGTWHAMGVMLSAAGSLRWLRDVGRRRAIAELLAEAERWPAGAEGLLFLPYLTGERTPHADPDARARVRRPDGAARPRRARPRGARRRRLRAARLARAAARARRSSPSVGRISGGGARSELWCTIVASVLGLPLERTAVDEGAAFGAALLGGVRAGVFADAHEAVASAVRVTGRVEPEDILAATTYAERLPALPLALPHTPAAFEPMIGRCAARTSRS